MSEEEDRFKWSVQALAMDYEIQLKLYPNFVEVADELALEFEETLERYLETGAGDHFDGAQSDCLSRLDSKLEAISGIGNLQYWTIEAMKNSPHWDEIRELAAATLFCFGWKVESPPCDRGYVFIINETE